MPPPPPEELAGPGPPEGDPGPPPADRAGRGRGRRAAAWTAGALFLGAVVLVTALATAGPRTVVPRDAAGRLDLPLIGADEQGLTDAQVAAFDPFPYDPEAEEDFLARGRDAYEHVLYVKSPGGVEAAAARTAGWRGRIQAVAAGNEVNPDTLEALVFLESGGRPDVMAAGDPDGAVGLTQILPETATDLLGMSVDLERSKRLTRRIERDRRRAVRARTATARRDAAVRLRDLIRERRRADDRFNPTVALEGGARYLALAEQRFGRGDLAAVAYHMGIGNLESVIEDYVAPRRPRRRTKTTVEAFDISYPRLFFDSTPRRNARAYRRQASFGDDSRTYLFRLEAAEEIIGLQRDDPRELRELARRHLAKASAEEVLRPPAETDVFEDAGALREAYEDGDLAPLPGGARRLGLRADRRIGELARRVGEPAGLYRGLRPEALATVLFLAKETRRLSGDEDAVLVVTSGVRDLPYQRALTRINPQATEGYSLHTTGYAVDLTLPRSGPRRQALEATLERLRSLRVLDFVHEPGAVHLTVGQDAERLLPLYEGMLEER